MNPSLPLLVFSDLDGTLLDHHDYSWAAAQPGLERLVEIGAGLVLASSKTSAEIRPLQQELGVSDMPAIVENGAGVLWPGDEVDDAWGVYEELRSTLQQLPSGFHGFGDMTDLEISEITGLSTKQAARARQRQFSEPGKWTGSDAELKRFLSLAAERGIAARQGGRFLTLSFGKSKADAMGEVVERLKPARTIALGDAPNDIEMIQTADQGVVVANPDGPTIPDFPPEIEARVLRTKHSGPRGWSDAILSLTAASE